MTTIAYKAGVLASDSKISGANGGHWANVAKIKKIDNYLLGYCGDVDLGYHFMSKFDPKFLVGKAAIKWDFGVKSGDFEAIVVDPFRRIFRISERLLITPVLSHGFIAIGSGEPVAMGAMFAGASAIAAVKACKVLDAGTGGKIRHVKLGK